MREIEHPVSGRIVLERVERCAQQRIGAEEVRTQADGFFERRASFREPFQAEVGDAEVVVDLERIRIQLRGALEGLDGFFVPSVFPVEHAERGELVGIVGIEQPLADFERPGRGLRA